MIKNCLKCNKEFSKSVFCSKKEWETRLYCSHSCANSVNSKGNSHCIGRIPWNKELKGKSGKENPNKFHSEYGFNKNNQAQIDNFLSSVAQEA